MMTLSIWILIFSISCLVDGDFGLECLQCKNIISPRWCKRVTQCSVGEVCSVQRQTNEFGEIVYDLGCSPDTPCRNVSSESQSSMCTQCCDLDLCNHVGCNEPDYPVSRGPICYNCQNPTPAGRCHDIELCDQNKICKVAARNTFGETLYTSSCELQHTCSAHQGPGIVGRRETENIRSNENIHACDTCCSADLCNRDCQTANQHINGKWTEWSTWGSCSLTCGDGLEHRHRTCTNPSSADVGTTCPGGTTETRTCTMQACPTDGQWELWSTWSNCSVACGDGTETRNRSCSNPSPDNGGKKCAGLDVETKPCHMRQCIIVYDCSDVLKLGISHGSGLYRITPWNTHREVDVYCDMDTEGGGWTVFQRRWNGSVAFNRSFVDYEQGFGSLDGEFWMGLGILQSMTSRGNMTLHMDMSLLDGTTGFDEYSGFYISPPDRYNFNVDRRINSRRMTNSHLLSDTGSFWGINHQPFSTYDRDVDSDQGGNCAQLYGGGWWFNDCMHNNLNGPYTSATFYYQSFVVGGLKERLETSTMMFRLSS